MNSYETRCPTTFHKLPRLMSTGIVACCRAAVRSIWSTTFWRGRGVWKNGALPVQLRQLLVLRRHLGSLWPRVYPELVVRAKAGAGSCRRRCSLRIVCPELALPQRDGVLCQFRAATRRGLVLQWPAVRPCQLTAAAPQVGSPRSHLPGQGGHGSLPQLGSPPRRVAASVPGRAGRASLVGLCA